MCNESAASKECINKKVVLKDICCTCRDQQVDWKALRCSLQKSLSANTAAIDPVQPAQALMRNTPMSSGLSIVWTARHDSASSSIEVCRGNSGVPTTLRTPRVPALGKLGVAGSLPVHSYCKPVPAPSCPVSPYWPHPASVLVRSSRETATSCAV